MKSLCTRLLDAEKLLRAVEAAFLKRGDTIPRDVLEARDAFNTISTQDIIRESEVSKLETLITELAEDYLDN